MTAIRNKVKPDTVLKNFWRDNQRFADVFNTVLFNGKHAELSELERNKPFKKARNAYAFFHAGDSSRRGQRALLPVEKR